jgi:hypothetical protein
VPLSIQGEQQAHIQDALFASPADGAAFIEHLPEQYRRCREARHIYMPFRAVTKPVDVPLARAKTLTRIRRCACGAEHHQLLNPRTGALLEKPRIKYPPDYLAKGIGRLPAETYGLLRLAAFQREMEATDVAPPRPVKRTARKAG